MSKKKKGNSNFSKKMPVNLVKKYANFAHCDKCGNEQRMKRIKVLHVKSRMAWVCIACSNILPFGSEAQPKIY